MVALGDDLAPSDSVSRESSMSLKYGLVLAKEFDLRVMNINELLPLGPSWPQRVVHSKPDAPATRRVWNQLDSCDTLPSAVPDNTIELE